ncbi:MAG TPA: RNA polymerase sigma factor [Ktedonobacterales bacterium]
MLERLPVAWQGKAQTSMHGKMRSALRVVAPSASVVSEWEQSDVMSQSKEQAAVAREEKEALLTAVYHEYSGQIHSYASRLLGNMEDADDITQEVFIRVHGHLAELRDPARIKSWLYRIATNLCMDQLRRRSRTRRIFGIAVPLGGESDDGDHTPAREVANPGSSAPIDQVAERDHIAGALREMPPKYAVCLMLHSAQGLSYREIADILGISPGAAAVRLTRARDLFGRHYNALRGEGSR